MKASENSAKELHPLLEELNSYLADNNISLKSASDILYDRYLNDERKKSSFYQRLNKLVTGETQGLTIEEQHAIIRYLHVERNLHTYGEILHNIDSIKKKLSFIDKAISSRIFNPNQVKAILKSLHTLTQLDTDSLSNNN